MKKIDWQWVGLVVLTILVTLFVVVAMAIVPHAHGMPALPLGSPYVQRGPMLPTAPGAGVYPRRYRTTHGPTYPPMLDPWGVPYRYQPRRPYGR